MAHLLRSTFDDLQQMSRTCKPRHSESIKIASRVLDDAAHCQAFSTPTRILSPPGNSHHLLTPYSCSILVIYNFKSSAIHKIDPANKASVTMPPISIFAIQPRHIARQTSTLEPYHSTPGSLAIYNTYSTISTSTQSLISQIVRRSNRSNSPNSGAVVAAVLSSILGTLVCLTLIYKCCINNRSAAYIPPAYTSYSSSSVSLDDNNGGVRRRGGGSYGQYHYGLRRPERVRIRTRSRVGGSRRSETSYSSGHGSRYRETHVRRFRAVRGSKDGMLGWFWMPRTGYEYGNRRYGWPRNRFYDDCVDD